MIIGLIFLVLIGVAIIYGSDWRLQGQNTPFVSPVSSKTPLDIVKERYALAKSAQKSTTSCVTR